VGGSTVIRSAGLSFPSGIAAFPIEQQPVPCTTTSLPWVTEWARPPRSLFLRAYYSSLAIHPAMHYRGKARHRRSSSMGIWLPRRTCCCHRHVVHCTVQCLVEGVRHLLVWTLARRTGWTTSGFGYIFEERDWILWLQEAQEGTATA
jgi:hypothetical protein